MNQLVFIGVLLGNLTITSYQPKVAQTDSSPWTTCTGERVHPHGIALSRNLLKRWGGPVDYGDWIYIEGYGLKVVNDCMSDTRYDKDRRVRVPIVNAVDIWVPTLEEEKKVGTKHLKVWIIRRKLQ